MNCPHCGSEEFEKVRHDMFDDTFRCSACDEEFDAPRVPRTDPEEWGDDID